MSLEDLSIFCTLSRSFSSVICSSSWRGHLHPLLSLFLSIWFFFEAIVNGIVFLYSFSIFSLLLYRKATGFCKLILYPATVLKLFMMSRSFGAEFFRCFFFFYRNVKIIYFYSFMHMCIHCLGHFSLLPPTPSFSPTPPHFWVFKL
jgi:hypothetical protein